MRLSPAKIALYAEGLVDVLADTDGVLFDCDDADLRVAISEIITDELMVEERLDAELHDLLQKTPTTKSPCGASTTTNSSEKAQEIRKRGIIL
jgi:hypothetical protein